MQSDDNIDSNYNKPANKKNSFNNKRITAFEQILDIQKMPVSEEVIVTDYMTASYQKSHPYPVNYKRNNH